MIWIGIDTGTHTGFAVWDGSRFVAISTLPIHQALEEVMKWKAQTDELFVVFEDARQRKWYGERSNAKMQGAGSVKRDCNIWEDFLKDKRIPYRAVPPTPGATKLSAAYFKQISHWEGKTSEHARDAAMLVIGQKRPKQYF